MVKYRRIFWLGMHKILRSTELVQLRAMGYEVFSPEYISPIYDQSADLTPQAHQYTTLPPGVFRRLLEYDFFYRPIQEDIAELLNAYFDAAIVTINPDWLFSFLDAYGGPVVYRIYGQPYSLSEHCTANGRWTTLLTRPNFSIVPFANESVEREQPWFRELCVEAVPYQIPDDVFEFVGNRPKRPRSEVAVSIPNISNPYYASAYHDFVMNFPDVFFRIYGPQREIPADGRVIGELSRQRFLGCLQSSSGFLYPYRDNVCYLPPIESMQLGCPVVYMPNSLLARFSDPRNPGAARSAEHARQLCERLKDGDTRLAAEIVAAQEPVRQRYDRSLVKPQFERTIRRLLENPARPPSARLQDRLIRGQGAANNKMPFAIIPLHVDGLFHRIDGRPVALEGIPRVVEAVVDTLVENTDSTILLSCTHDSQSVIFDFFKDQIEAGRVVLYAFGVDSTSSAASFNFHRLRFVDYVSAIADRVATVFIPHYYLFPEVSLVAASKTLYLPDYFPHLMPDQVFDTSVEKDQSNKAVGRMLARGVERILTNSQFTKDYLPDTGLVDKLESDKVIVAPLPFLGSKRAGALGEQGRKRIEDNLNGRPFIFYPTANRPNKKLTFFVRLLAHLRLEYPELCAVLTCDLNSVPEVAESATNYQLSEALVMIPGATEDMMQWFYENTVALCLTSVAEGNFPPQVLEALNYGAPIVATRLPTIIEIAHDKADRLLLCEPMDLISFANGVRRALEARNVVLKGQADLLNSLTRWNSKQAFSAALSLAFPNLKFHASALPASAVELSQRKARKSNTAVA